MLWLRADSYDVSSPVPFSIESKWVVPPASRGLTAFLGIISHRFGKEFTSAVEQKQIAQQDAERAKFVVEKVGHHEQIQLTAVSLQLEIRGQFANICVSFFQAEQERQAAVIRAEGEAEAASTIQKSLDRAGEAFVAFRRIEASKDIGEYCVGDPTSGHVTAADRNQTLLIVHSPANSLAGSRNVTYLPSSSGMLMQVNPNNN